MNSRPRSPQALIAVVTQQRSGSKWFGSLVRRRYGTTALGEVFNPDDTSMMSYRSYLSGMTVDSLIGSDFRKSLDRYFDRIRVYCGLFYTFDIMFNQMDWVNFGWSDGGPFMYDYLKSREDIVVSIVRDPREIFVSMKALQLTQKAHFTEMDSGESGPAPTLPCVSIHFSEYLDFRTKLLADRMRLSKHFEGYEDYIELHYNDLLRDPAEALVPLDCALRRFGKRIGHDFARGITPMPDLIKTPVRYGDLIDNLDEVFSWPS